MQTKSVCHRHPSRLPGDGSCSTTEFVILLRAVCIGWAWRSSSWRIRQSVCCEEIRGCLDQKRRTKSTATSMTSCFLVDTRWTPMAIRSIFIMALRIARLPLLGPVCALFSSGWTPMAAATAGESRIDEPAALDFSTHLRLLPPQAPEPCLHHQTSHLQGLLRLWSGIRFAGLAVAIAYCCIAPRPR